MALWFLTALWLAATPAQPLNSVVAVVEGVPITMWDMQVEARLRALEQRGTVLTSAIPDNELLISLEQLINQMLAVQAAERFHVPWPDEHEVEAELEDLRERAGEEVEAQLAAAAIPQDRLRYRYRVKLRIQALITRRLRDLVHVSDQDVNRYLEQYPTAGTDQTELVREYLITVRLQDRSRIFFQTLRDQATVHVLDERFGSAWEGRQRN
jgi:hypothetical protein